MIKFGKTPDYPAAKMGGDAARQALEQAGIRATQVQATFCGNISNPPNLAQRVNGEMGVSGIPAFNHENACASSSAAFRQGVLAVSKKIHEYVLVVGVENMTCHIASGVVAAGPLVLPHGANLEADNGMLMPAGFALLGRRHMHEFGTTAEQFARIAVKNHKHSALNPYAQYQKVFSLEEVLNSRMVCDPLTLYQCCPIGDGAAAVILTSAKNAKKHATKPVFVRGSVLTSGKYKASAEGPPRIDACVSAA
jgi:benzoylsuccinyl-CoA thiolase BbsB subunit